MATEKKPAASKSRKKPAAPKEPEQPQADAVIVVRQVGEEGVTWAVAELVGNVAPDQVSTGLRLAAKDVDERLGIAVA